MPGSARRLGVAVAAGLILCSCFALPASAARLHRADDAQVIDSGKGQQKQQLGANPAPPTFPDSYEVGRSGLEQLGG